MNSLASKQAAGHTAIGNSLYHKGSFKEAEREFEQALRLNPANLESLVNLAATLDEQERFAEALACYERALNLGQDQPELLFNMGNTLFNLLRFAEAEECYRKALALVPGRQEIALGIGAAIQAEGRVGEAIAWWRKIVAQWPDSAEAHWNLSLTLLLNGDYAEGWREFEWRWNKETFSSPRRGFQEPLWDGSPLAGRTILLHGEQGLGDTLQFVRYAQLVEAHGGRVLVEGQSSSLRPVLERIVGVSQVYVMGEPLPPFSCHAPLMSLPLIFGTTIDTIPAPVPYISPDPVRSAEWHARLAGDGSFRVGLVWGGSRQHRNDRSRSIPLGALAPLFLPGLTLYSLQMGPAAVQLAGLDLNDLTSQLADFSDTAAFIANLDLVISVDTSVAHLAGAMGKPVWLLLPSAPDWRWGLEREDSPWYPTMRLFRQSFPGDWHGVVERVRSALEDRAAEELNDRGKSLRAEGRNAEALSCYDHALLLDPEAAAIHYNRGNCCVDLWLSEEAIAAYRRALAIEPDFLAALNNLGIALRLHGRIEEAADCFEQVLSRDPDFADAHWNLALIKLMQGRLAEGWEEYEWRLKKTDPVKERTFAVPAWDGADPSGRTILIHTEQGLGDTIQFIRYATLLARLGARVIVECQTESLRKVVARVEGVGTVLVRGEPLPIFDLHVSLMSLPRLMGTRLDSIPADMPCITADPLDEAAWSSRLERVEDLRVGLVWGGSVSPGWERRRTISLAQLAPLASPHVVFYSLQLGPAAVEAADPPEGMCLVDYTAEIHSFADTAAFIANLDLVISVDTSVGHLAGAMGKPVWLLLLAAPDWRWFLEREDSPWYPTMRLFRQAKAGDWPEVMRRVQRALEEETARHLCRTALARQHGGDVIAAIAAYRQVLEVDPDNRGALRQLGFLTSLAGDHAGAAGWFARLAELEPSEAETFNNLGVLLDKSGDHSLALRAYGAALALRNDFAEVWYNAGNCCRDMGGMDEAIARYRRALELQPDFPEAAYNLANTLRAADQLDEAAAVYLTLLAVHPDHLPARTNLAGALLALEQPAEAILHCRQALAQDPDNAEAHGNLAQALLALGQFQEGWQEYEWRFRLKGVTIVESSDKPRWDGTPLPQGTILLRTEQGFGDTFQFLRYLPLVAQRIGRVILECREELYSLLQSSAVGCQIVLRGEPLPPYDVQSALLSLPLLFGTTLATIPPPISSIQPADALVGQWRERIAVYDGLRVGLVWGGQQHKVLGLKRSARLEQFAPLAEVPKVTFFTLQLWEGAEQAANPPPGMALADLTFLIRDFSDTAALIANLDLVITIDTAVAHLAGAMGKPVWTLLHRGADWRWGIGRADSSWYPTMRLFRQENLGDWTGVIAQVCAALKTVAENGDAWLDIGNTRRTSGCIAEAVAAYRTACALNPASSIAATALGSTLLDMGRSDEALEWCRRAVELNPDSADASNNLGTALVAAGNREEAMPMFSRALELRPDYLPAYINLGAALQYNYRYDEAIALYKRAIAIRPDCREARINLGTALQDMGNPREAIDVYRGILTLWPDCAEAHWNLAWNLLLTGDFQEGWREYEWRRAPELAKEAFRQFPAPEWDGSEPGERTILLHAEQGLGDTIQFARYASLLAEHGFRVVGECQTDSLRRLLQSVPGVASWSVRGEELPPHDCQFPLMSLPFTCGTTLATMPARTPYLAAEGELVDFWRGKIGGGGSFRIGIAWSGAFYRGDRRKRCPIEQFQPLVELPGVTLHSLQVDESARDAVRLPGMVADLSGQIRDFADTAAIIANLDLVISIDTAVAHLAGALGKDVWTLLPFAPDWRWLEERDDSPWYPTMRLFRQKEPGGWSELFERVRAALHFHLRFRSTLAAKPDFAGDSFNRGNALLAEGKVAEAVACYRAVLAQRPDLAGAHNNLAVALRSLGETVEAAEHFRCTLKVDLANCAALQNLGELCLAEERHGEAVACLEKLVQCDPGNAEAWYLFGAALSGTGEPHQAIASYRRALELRPEYPDALNNMGLALKSEGRLAEAIDYYRRAIDTDPSFLHALNNLGLAYRARNETAKAAACYRRAIELDPFFAEAHWNLGLVNLLEGNFSEGWEGYEWRWRIRGAAPRVIAQPQWDGSLLAGRTILVYAEQGFGDTIQFIRYLPLLAARGAKVLLECRRGGVEPLLAGIAGISRLIRAGEALPEFHVQAPLLSLPRLCGTTLDSIPVEVPYLAPLPQHSALWRERLPVDDPTLKVGLVWAGTRTDPLRSCPLALFGMMAEMPGITFYSLQLENDEQPPVGLRLIDLTTHLHDFADTAALISQLDLVISIDTAVAHLAGALAKPVWTLLPFAADWRWGLGREDSPWYPTMRLFRQEQPGGWEEVLGRVKMALLSLTATTSPADSAPSATASCRSWFEQGLGYRERGEWREAEECCRKALAICPDDVPALVNLGEALHGQNRPQEAIEVYRSAVAADPASVYGHWNLSLALLLLGEFREGWREYEWRRSLLNKQLPVGEFLVPLGSEPDLAGQTILVHAEQGYGDTLMFIRYVPLLARCNCRVVVTCQARLMRLIERVEGVSSLIRLGDPLPAFDRQALLLSMPYLFGSTIETVPDNIPYITADPALEETWGRRVTAEGTRIGLVWAGNRSYSNDRNRSLPLAMLAPLGELDGIAWCSLQLGEARAELEQLPAGMAMADLMEGVADFADTAALIAQLDLVITVDTAVAHLAGAMGKPVWLLLPFAFNWRWLLEREDSPWYPTMRLFRQAREGAWTEVVEQVTRELQVFAPVDFNRCRELYEQGNHAAAIAGYRRLLSQNPAHADARNNLAVALQAQGRLAEALACYRQVVGVRPEQAPGWYNLGYALETAGEIDEATACYRRAIVCQPDHAGAHFNLSLLLLLAGNLAEGWREFEWRWQAPGFSMAPRQFNWPLWNGGELEGRTILLHCEQGYGDTLQFIRYAPLIAQRGGRVLVACPAEVQPLVARVAGVAEAFVPVGPLPAFELHAPLLSLPLIFGTTMETMPAEVPYLFPDPGKMAQWQDRMGADERFRVGIVWSGAQHPPANRKRSCRLAEFAPLAGIPGISWFSLQLGAAGQEASNPPQGMELIDCSASIVDFDDTAALIANLDLVISIDTSVAHLAGALGKPVWVMLPKLPDWRWLLDKDDSPWYPTMRLFRQEKAGEWEGVVLKLAAALRMAAAHEGRAVAVDTAPEKVIIETTTTCNRRCHYCPNYTVGRPERLMDEAVFCKIIDSLASYDYRGMILPHLYGEPLTDLRLEKLIGYTRHRLPAATIVLYSNGELLTVERYLALKRAGVDLFRISQHTPQPKTSLLRVLSQIKENHPELYTVDYLDFYNNDDYKGNRGGLVDVQRCVTGLCSAVTELTFDYLGNAILCCNDYSSTVILDTINEHDTGQIWNSPGYAALRTQLRNGNYHLDICKRCRGIN